jgi:transcriptional regulator with XRE-family HTH domain
MSGQIEKLTRGERLFIERRRLGESQKQAAARYEATLTRYSRWERDIEDEPLLGLQPLISAALLTPYERAVIHRRRAGITQGELARRLGRSKMHIRKIELGVIGNTELIEYWEGA